MMREETALCPRLYLSQRDTKSGKFTIDAAEIKQLSEEARLTNSEPGMLIQFSSVAPRDAHWALIPYELFRQLLEQTQVPASAPAPAEVSVHHHV